MKCRAAYRRQHSVSSVFFFLLSGMMAPHANYPRNTLTLSRSYHFHGTPVRFVRLLPSRSTRLIEWASKCLSLFCRDAFYHFGTNRTQKKPYRPIISRQAIMQWLGTSEVREKSKKRVVQVASPKSRNVFIQTYMIATFHKPLRLSRCLKPILDINFKCSLHFHLPYRKFSFGPCNLTFINREWKEKKRKEKNKTRHACILNTWNSYELPSKRGNSSRSFQ